MEGFPSCVSVCVLPRIRRHALWQWNFQCTFSVAILPINLFMPISFKNLWVCYSAIMLPSLITSSVHLRIFISLYHICAKRAAIQGLGCVSCSTWKMMLEPVTCGLRNAHKNVQFSPITQKSALSRGGGWGGDWFCIHCAATRENYMRGWFQCIIEKSWKEAFLFGSWCTPWPWHGAAILMAAPFSFIIHFLLTYQPSHLHSKLYGCNTIL